MFGDRTFFGSSNKIALLPYAHHLVALRDGVVIASGNPADVITEEMVQQVFGLACRIVPDPVTGKPWCVSLGRQPHK